MRRVTAVGVVGIIAIALVGSAAELDQPQQAGFPPEGILPKTETGALRFLAEYPEYDGRGVVVAIFDTGVDPGAPGLSRTTTGEQKLVDIIDATGSGDVDTTSISHLEDGALTSLTGRELRVPGEWNCPSGEFHLGMKAAYDFFPEDLFPRLKKTRKEEFAIRHRELEQALREEKPDADDKTAVKEHEARLESLTAAWESYRDPGPVYDCVLFHDGEMWRAVVDTDEDGDLGDEKLLADFRETGEYATFDDESRLNFSVKVYDNGNLLSLVTVGDEHGTHVAGIVAAHDPLHPERNGLAPGARIVSVRIGDARLQGMETGAALLRGLKEVLDHKCDLINMSFGEPTTTPDQGALVERFNEIVREHNILFFSSAGNSGPALSTVGAPGGTTSAVIGVGAYVSPAMMDVEYSLRGLDKDLAYTWTSRGPAADGDMGVDILAPGGAISPVPTYSLQPGRQMNGTSMSSPNACGNVALLLSGLKQLSHTYSPVSVLRSLQATALQVASVDEFARGAGLLQVDRAFTHHLKWGDAPGQQVELEARIPGRANARGIYLRESAEANQVMNDVLSIKPHFPKSLNNDQRLKFQLPLKLTTTADWVQLGEHLMLAHDGDWIPVRVDPRRLSPGVHSAEIVLQDADQPGRGPLLRVPVTVIRPVQASQAHWEGRVRVSPEKLSRTFFAVPEGAQSARLRLRRRGGDAPLEYMVHTLQLESAGSFEDHEVNESLLLSPNEEYDSRFAVASGRTLEVCVAQYWTNPGSSELDVELDFHGFRVSEDTVSLPGGGGVAQLRVTSVLRHEKLKPQAYLETWDRTLAPSSAKIDQLDEERDELWDQQRISRLLLEYEFTQSAAGAVSFICPRLNGLLYDSPVGSLRIFLYDAADQMVKAEDVYPEEVDLAPGDYTIRVELRHPSRDVLEKFKTLRIVVSQPLEETISIDIADTRAEAAAGGGDEDSTLSTELAPGESARLFLRFPEDASLPEGFSLGDSLTGSLTLDEEEFASIPLSVRPASLAERDLADTEDEDEPMDKEYDVLRAEEDLLGSALEALEWPRDEIAIGYLLRRMQLLRPDNRRPLVEKLHLLDTDDRDDRLAEVITAAEEVLAGIDTQRLQLYFGLRHDPQTAEEKLLDKERKAERADLIDALYRLARALAFRELPEIAEKHPVDDPAENDRRFLDAYRRLAEWADPADDDHFLVFIRHERRQGRPGAALKRLRQALDEDSADRLLNEKRVELYEELGWDIWRDNAQHWFWREFPDQRQPL